MAITSKEILGVNNAIEIAQETSIRSKWEHTLRVSHAAHQYASDRLRSDSDMHTDVDDGVIYTGLFDDGGRWRVRLVDPWHIAAPT